MEMSWQYTLCSWAGFSALAGFGYYYYTQNNQRRPGNRAPVPSREQQEARPGRGRRRDGQADASGSDARRGSLKDGTERGLKRKASKPQPQSNKFEALKDEGGELPSEEDNDKEWAAQLDNLRKGTNLAAPARKEARTKTVKQSSASRTPELSATSSTTGGDADDDLSPRLSPALDATNAKGANDVSDMLEPTAAAPTVLRVAPAEVKPKGTAEQGWELAGKKDKPKKQDTAVNNEAETKRQRQNKRKVEEQKTQREADEQARRVLMEKQRRTAREARGEAAKNGVSSWSAGRPESTKASAPAVGSLNEPMLDTFDSHDAASTASSSNAAANTSSPISNTTSSHSYWEQLPSEQEQMRQLRDQDESSWNTVTDKKKNRKKAAQEAKVNGEVKEPAPSVKRPESPLVNGNHEAFDFEKYRQQDDSDWAVA